MFLDLGRLLIRPDAVQFVEPCGDGAKINGSLSVSLTPTEILALMGAKTIAPEGPTGTADVAK